MSDKKSGRVASGTERNDFMKDMVQQAREQIDIDIFPEYDRDAAEQIARIIAEVYALPENASIRIDGVNLFAGLVAGVYDNLEYEHVSRVIENLREAQSANVKFLKSYIRTALYNAVFEDGLRDEML